MTEPEGPARPGASPRRRPAGSPVAWTAVLLAAVLTVWQAVYVFSQAVRPDTRDEVVAAVSLFVHLVVGLAAAVLGVVALSQRHRPAWPALAGLAVGLNGFLLGVAGWLGGLQAG